MEKSGVNGVLIRLIAVVSEETGIPVEQLSLSTKIEALGVDSLEFIVLIRALEEQFGKLNEQDVVRAQTVGDLLDSLHSTAT